MTFLDKIFNPWLGWTLNLPSFWAIFIISVFITVLVTVAYKYTTNQSEMKRIRDDLKKYQKEMKETKDTKKLMAIQKKSLELNMTYMKSSFKSTLYTFIPIIIIFAWLNMHIAYEQIMPNQDFTVTAEFAEGAKGSVSLMTTPELTGAGTREIVDDKVVWTLNGVAGEYDIKLTYNTEEYTHKVLVTEENAYSTPEKLIKDSKLKRIINGNREVTPFGEKFNIFGWHPGWLATYIVLSIALSSILRKVMKVY